MTNKYVDLFKPQDGASAPLILVAIPGDPTARLWLEPEMARMIAIELFDAYLSIT